MRGLVAGRRDRMDVEIERPRRARVEVELEPGLLARLAQRRVLEAAVRRLDVPSGLQQPAQLRVRDEARSLALVVEHERRRGEVRAGLPARERLLELVGQAQHRAAVGLLALVARHELTEEDGDRALASHSYWSASRTLSRAARRAGKIAARMPTTIAAIAKTISDVNGSENWMKSTR